MPFEQCPGIYESYVSDEHGNGKVVRLAMWDTAGAYEFQRLEPLKYPGAQVVLISFAIDDPYSFDRVEEKVSLSHALRFLLAMSSSTSTTNCLLTTG